MRSWELEVITFGRIWQWNFSCQLLHISELKTGLIEITDNAYANFKVWTVNLFLIRNILQSLLWRGDISLSASRTMKRQFCSVSVVVVGKERGRFPRGLLTTVLHLPLSIPITHTHTHIRTKERDLHFVWNVVTFHFQTSVSYLLPF